MTEPISGLLKRTPGDAFTRRKRRYPKRANNASKAAERSIVASTMAHNQEVPPGDSRRRFHQRGATLTKGAASSTGAASDATAVPVADGVLGGPIGCEASIAGSIIGGPTMAELTIGGGIK